MTDEIRLTLPAKENMLLVARMALAGYCCQFGADMDTLDDIRTVSDEACYALMHQPKEADLLFITAGIDGDMAHIRFEVKHTARTLLTDTAHDPEIAQGILSSLVSDVSLSHDKGSMHAIEVSIQLRLM